MKLYIDPGNKYNSWSNNGDDFELSKEAETFQQDLRDNAMSWILLRSHGQHFAENSLVLVEYMFCNSSIKDFPRQWTLSRSAELPLAMQLLPRELWVNDKATLSPKTPAPEHRRVSVFMFSFLGQQQKLEHGTLVRLEKWEGIWERGPRLSAKLCLLRCCRAHDSLAYRWPRFMTCQSHTEHVGKHSGLNKHWQNWNILCKHQAELRGRDKPIWCSAHHSLCGISLLSRLLLAGQI